MYLLIPIALVLAVLLSLWRRFSKASIEPQGKSEEFERDDSLSVYQDIKAESHFDWSTTEPLQTAPFRSIFHLTMGLQACTFDELIAMDKTYRDKITLRRRILSEEYKNVVACNPVGQDAVYELYTWMTSTYLPKRYPNMFRLLPEKHSLHNIVLDEYLPLHPAASGPSTAEECLRLLGAHVDTDFLLLLPSPSPNARCARALPTPTPSHPYYLHAFVVCFPSGFSTPQKLGLPLAAIHAPVPGYATKLEKSMDRFFATLPFGKIVKRANWAVQTDYGWFKMSGNHMSTTASHDAGHGTEEDRMRPSMAPATYEPSPEDIAAWEAEGAKVVAEKCVLRSERQTLHRLPKTGALVFAFKTYQYPLPEVKAAGLGAEMADAVEGMWKGSVPAMTTYKRSVIWGKNVVEYLRSE